MSVEINTPAAFQIEIKVQPPRPIEIKRVGTQGVQGDRGNTGNAATVAIGTVATGAAGSPATVNNSGTSAAAVLDFTIPQGNPGTIQSVVPGSNVSVDSTDPANPVVSAAGDMLAATYDPQNSAADAFDMGNMIEATDAKIMTEAERTKLSGIESSADVTDATNVAAAGAVMDGDFTSNGTMFRIGVGSYASRVLTGTTGQINIASAGGGGGNPVFSLDTAIMSAVTNANSAVQPGAIGTAAAKNAGTAAGNVPVLDGSGKLVESTLPAIAITDVNVVASQAAMLALTAQTGDIAVRSDLNKTFALAAPPATTLANWVELRTPTDAVLSVAGKTGAVTLAKADVGLGSVDNTSDAGKPVSTATQTALNAKADTSSLGTAASKNVGTTAGTVAAGDDSRLSDQRTPLNGSVTDAKVATPATPANGILAAKILAGPLPFPGYIARSLLDKLGELVSLRDFGAAGDHVILSGNASITSGAAALTFTAGTFTSGDIGKKITVPGAGTAGADLVSTIAAVASTTAITLANNAATTLASSAREVSWGTDNSVALQKALDACSNGGARLYVPQGRYRCDSAVTSTGALSVMGYHISQSALIFGSNANWDHAGGAVGTGPTSQLFVSGLSVQSDDTHNTATALLNVHFSAGGSGSTVRTVTALDVEVCGTSLSRGFNVGMRLFNATNARIERPRLVGHNGLFASSVGILVDTDSQAVDFYINNPYAVFLDYGIKVIGQGLGAGFEGLSVDRAMMIACNYGVYVDSVSYHPYVHISGSNLCCFKKCIYIKNMINIQILGNYLYPAAGGANATWEGIHIDGDVVFPQYAQNIIANNIISGRAAIDITTRTGIKFNQPSGSNQQTLVDANSLDTLEIGEYLGTDVANVVSTSTNQFRTTTVVFDDESGTTTNILAGANFATPGNLTETSGLQMRWGTVGVTLDAGKRATITFTDPFKSTCLVAIANTGTAGKTGKVTSDIYAKTGFSVYLPDQAAGDSLNINYIALGA